MAATDDPEKCVTVTVPQLQEMLAQGKSELAASQQRLMHEQKEREKTEALLEQQRHFAQASAAEAAAREAELRKSLETARVHATQELNDSKAFWQGQLARASEALQAAEAEAAAWREEAVALQEEVQHGIETCAYSADKAHLMLAEAVQRAEQEQFQMRASTEARIAAAQAKQTEAEGRALAIGLALATDREALQRAQQEAAVAADVHHKVENALAAARAELKASEAELMSCRDRHEADEAAFARLAEEQRQIIAAAEEDSKTSAQEIEQLRCECTQAFAALEDARARGLELEGELQHARTRLDEVLDREARQVEELQAELTRARTISSSVEADLDIAAGHHTQSRETLEEEWAERQRQQNLVWHARERDLKDTHHAASRQLVEMHHAELDEYKRQQRLLEDKIADMEAEHLREQNEVRNRDEQLAELNSALEELEDEKRRDMLAQQTQSHEQMRAVCVRLHQHYHHKLAAQTARHKAHLEAVARDVLAHTSALDASLDYDNSMIQALVPDFDSVLRDLQLPHPDATAAARVTPTSFRGLGGVDLSLPSPVGRVSEMGWRGGDVGCVGSAQSVAKHAGWDMSALLAGIGGMAGAADVDATLSGATAGHASAMAGQGVAAATKTSGPRGTGGGNLVADGDEALGVSDKPADTDAGIATRAPLLEGCGADAGCAAEMATATTGVDVGVGAGSVGTGREIEPLKLDVHSVGQRLFAS